MKKSIALEKKHYQARYKSIVSTQEKTVKKEGKESNKIAPSLVKLPPYRNYEKSTKTLTHWQALFLTNKGLSFTETSKILCIHKQTVSRWWQYHVKSKNKLNDKEKLNKIFTPLSSEIKAVLTRQVTQLKNDGESLKSITTTLGLTNITFTSNLLKAETKRKTTNEKPIVTLKKVVKKEIKKPVNKTSKLNKNSRKPVKSPSVDPSLGEFVTLETKGNREVINLTESNTTISKIDPEKSLKRKTPIINKLKKLLGFSSKEILDLNSETSSEREQSLSPFYLVDPEALIKIKADTKIIKEKDYAQYCESTDLLKASKELYEKSKKLANEIEQQTIESANLKADRILEVAKEKGERKANNLLASTNIDATKASIEHISAIEEDLPDLVMSVVRKIINNYDDQDFVMSNIKSAVKELSGNEEIKIHVSNNILDSVNKQLSEATYSGRIILVPDASLNDKDCLIVTNQGIINACLETQLQKIEADMTAPKQEDGHQVTIAF